MITKNGYVLTGGPGGGKTTVISALQDMGYATVAESGRNIIQEQVSVGGNALPWGDTMLFRDKMLEAAVRDYSSWGHQPGPVFLDRGIPDVIAYTKLTGMLLSADMQALGTRFRYHPHVFVFPPWEDIFRGDAERKQSFTTAVRTYEVIREVYAGYGYELITVPCVRVAERVAFILSCL
ncbi:MAG TPA: AAA family ATPase [Chitinophaga sp.]|uniref:AAA family ATPase n=1 Tax=Chitinophaga sp. TaxID=1869181 RepID=UPI002C555C18|nr:AAA family ATPase [Chitinophaga sp.]HVI47238.1 AAA family ATPase [Chitinophaga sp.]